ncbi:MAG: hypothetical protein LBQ77_01920 [Treponema sp.]|jgi:transglutaminase-like putative cysteine protease/tetratricopeptide (TPR) repeat protein|nr:hypothetical protein [Treponema sp.]
MNRQQNIAVFLNVGALFIIFYQFRLFAADVVDTVFFSTALTVACLSAAILYAKKLPLWISCIVLAALPWICRFLLIVPRFFYGNSIAVFLDSLLLSWDRNIAIVLIPEYYIAFSTYGSFYSRALLRANIIISDTIIIITWSIISPLPYYRWPIICIILIAVVLIVQLIALMLSLPPHLKITWKERAPSFAFILILITGGTVFFLIPIQTQQTKGGLLENNMMHQDFSQTVKLETEITLPNAELALILKKDSSDEHTLIRRSVFSAYTKADGFFHSSSDEEAHPTTVPQWKTVREPPIQSAEFSTIKQEYFLVNIDGSALLAISEPTVITPFEQWDNASFLSAYSVESNTAIIPETIEDIPRTADAFQLTEEAYALYTYYDNDNRIADLAKELVRSTQSIWEQVGLLFEYLKYGEYRYSLKSGIAPDGDQLGYFLFETKKGYCSYFAVAFTLLCRAIGIPARVASGFYLDPQTEVFGYYPIQSDQAHAWTEILVPGIGWWELDPTTDQLAFGEEMSMSRGTDNKFEPLIREILENRNRLWERPERPEDADYTHTALSPIEQIVALVKKLWIAITIALLLILYTVRKFAYLALSYIHRNPRKKMKYLWLYTRSLLRRSGLKPAPFQADVDFIQSLAMPDVQALYHEYASARFAPYYAPEHVHGAFKRFRRFSRQYTKKTPLVRRILMSLLIVFNFFISADRTYAEDTSTINQLFDEAAAAEHAEYWERAIELYTKGADTAPFDPRFSQALGTIYYNKRLFNLAWEYYKKTEPLMPSSPDLLYQLAQTAAALNEDLISAQYWEKLLELDPDNTDVISNLGWTYFKIHRFEAGEQLLLSALERLGANRSMAMTLGTVYAAMFRYNDSKYWYKESIREADSLYDRPFSAIAHYNLSILESRFYQFDNALKEVRDSVNRYEWTSGHLAMGELNQRTLDFPSTFHEYQKAYGLEERSPLAKESLAQSYQHAGRLEEARLYVEDIFKSDDYSWMVNHGVDPTSFRRNIHKIAYKTYQGLAWTEQRTVRDSWGAWGKGILKIINYSFKAYIHKLLFHKYAIESARAYNNNQDVDVLLQYIDAFEDYPSRARTYLRTAQQVETALIPASIPSYLLLESRHSHTVEPVREALEQFDSLWERDQSAESYILLARAKKHDSQKAAEQLYRFNHGALRQHGIRLPVALNIKGASPSVEKKLKRLLKKAGFAAHDESSWTLVIDIYSDALISSAHCELIDTNITLLSQSIPFIDNNLGAFVRTLADTVFLK